MKGTYLEVVDLGLGVDPEGGLELADGTTVHLDGDGRAGSGAGDVDGEGLLAGEAQLVGVLAGDELERDDAHEHQVGPVDALERLGDHELDVLHPHALGGPIARAACRSQERRREP